MVADAVWRGEREHGPREENANCKSMIPPDSTFQKRRSTNTFSDHFAEVEACKLSHQDRPKLEGLAKLGRKLHPAQQLQPHIAKVVPKVCGPSLRKFELFKRCLVKSFSGRRIPIQGLRLDEA